MTERGLRRQRKVLRKSISTMGMERHESGEARIIPVILRPCLWHDLPFGKLLATPTDGKAVTKFPDRDDAFLDVTKAIQAAATELGADREKDAQGGNEDSTVGASSNPVAGSSVTTRTRDIRSGNLRIKRKFTDHEKDRFLDEAFEYIANYFEGSLTGLERRNQEVGIRFRRVDSNQFTAAIYINGDLASACRIWTAGRQTFGGIAYSSSDRGYDNSINESLSVDEDGYSLFLKPMGLFSRSDASEKLTNEGGAEYYWSKLLEPLQR